MPQAVMTGDTPDISKLIEFDWYEWVWFIPSTHANPKSKTDPESKKRYQLGESGDDSFENRGIGRYLGPALNVGQEMTYKVLTKRGTAVSRTTCFPLTQADLANPDVKARMDDWTASVSEILNNRFKPTTDEEEQAMFDVHDDVIVNPIVVETVDENNDEDIAAMQTQEEEVEPRPEADEMDYATFDKYIQAQVVVPKGGSNQLGTVVKRKETTKATSLESLIQTLC